jgi:hypothetical protein
MENFADDADLPDHDYESIYGHAAMHARQLARLDAIARKMEAQANDFHAWVAAREAQPQPEPPEDVQKR